MFVLDAATAVVKRGCVAGALLASTIECPMVTDEMSNSNVRFGLWRISFKVVILCLLFTAI